MRVERVRAGVVQVTLHASQLTTLLAAVRWVAEGSPGELPDAARQQIQQVLDDYDRALARLTATEVTTR